MSKVNLKNIENVEGEYHLMFFEGKNIIGKAKSDIMFASLAMLFFIAFVAVFILISGLNFYYVYFLLAFVVGFALIMMFNLYQRHVGKKQCVKAVLSSNPSDIVARDAGSKEKSLVFVKSMSNTIDKYEESEKYPNVVKRYIRHRKHKSIASEIDKFEENDSKAE